MAALEITEDQPETQKPVATGSSAALFDEAAQSAAKARAAAGARYFTGYGESSGAKPDDRNIPLLKMGEKANCTYEPKASGAMIGRDREGAIRSIVRTDRTETTALKDGDRNLILESDKLGTARTVWTERSNLATKAPEWVSNENPPRTRLNYKMEPNGNVSYEENGKRNIVRGDGAQVQEDPKKPVYTFDASGRIQWVAYPGGNDLLGFNYKGETNEVNGVYQHDRRTGKTKTTVPDASWGEPKVDPDGTFHRVRYAKFGSETIPLKDTFHPDGSARSEELSARGCVATRDENHKLISVSRPDGVSFTRSQSTDGKEQIVVAHGKDSLTWTQAENGKWGAPGKPDRTGLDFDNDGNLTWNGSPKPAVSVVPEPDTIRPKIDRQDQRESNKEIKEARKGLKGDGPISCNDEDVAAARANLEDQLKKAGHLDTVRVILNEFEANTLEARKLHERSSQLPLATNLAERLDLKHYDPDAVPSNARVADAYKQAADALAGAGVGYCQSDRAKAKLVIEGLRNISDVTGIDQGQYTTCGPASGEKYIAARRPDEYMNGLKQLIQTGAYTTPHGNAYSYTGQTWMTGEDSRRVLRPELAPGNEERLWDYKNEGRPNRVGNLLRVQDGQRNYASQAWQNLFLANARQSYQSGQIPDAITCQMQVGNSMTTVPSTTFRHIEDFTARATGTPMTTINQQGAIPSAANIPYGMDDRLAERLQNSGRYPVLDWVGPHWFTDNGAVKLPNGQVLIHTDNQWGRAYDPNWTPVAGRARMIEAAIARQQGSAR